uniref:E3 ubiquitin-protein ligase SPL2 n=1 Tax=Erigeron canadensis TaxID=72917 RepID=UPI001CB89F41|nr:E3 ubiquitin-protein ligase SPL2 [Erigeron canadensis]
MSSVYEQPAIALVAHIATALDGAVVGVALACIAVNSILNLRTTSSALKKIKASPSVTVSDLRSLLSSDDDTNSADNKLVIVRGVVEPTSAATLLSHVTNEAAVIVQRTQLCIYNQWRGFFGWNTDFMSLVARHWKEQEASSLRTVPFILVDGVKQPKCDYLTVNLDGSTHSLPLTTVYHNLQPVHASAYTFFQAFFGHEYPVGVVDEEKILPVGKEITAVGLVRLKDGNPEVMASKDLPFFLSHMSKDEMVAELDFKTRVLWWSSIVIGTFATGILGYAILRNWNRWQLWKQQKRIQQQTAIEAEAMETEAEGSGSLPEEQLCVICLLRQRRSAFLPCGHLVCCPKCAMSVEREMSPKCPVCRQMVSASVRIFDS